MHKVISPTNMVLDQLRGWLSFPMLKSLGCGQLIKLCNEEKIRSGEADDEAENCPFL
jgi:hypothetical protein